jgi:hypothetical protein
METQPHWPAHDACANTGRQAASPLAKKYAPVSRTTLKLD